MQEFDFTHWRKKTAMFLTGQTISLFGSSLVQYAIIWYVLLQTNSGVMLTISSVCGFAPQVVIALFSGVWADRYSRKFLIIAADSLVAVSTLILAVFFMFGYNDLWLIFLVSGVRSVGSGIQGPAINAVLPQIVPQDKILRIGGINGSLQSVTFLISPAVGGLILSLFQIQFAFFVDVFTAVIGISLLALIKIPLHEKAKQKMRGGYFTDLKLGLQYIGKSKFLIQFFVFFGLFMLAVVPAAQLSPMIVTRTFGGDVTQLSLMEVFFSAGSLVGGIGMAVWGGFSNRTKTIALSTIWFAVCSFLIGSIPVWWVFLALMLLAGVSMPIMITPSTAMLQEQIDVNMQGRVFSFVQIIMTACAPLGMALFGPLADIVSVELLMQITAVAVLVLGIWVAANKTFRSGKIFETEA